MYNEIWLALVTSVIISQSCSMKTGYYGTKIIWSL